MDNKKIKTYSLAVASITFGSLAGRINAAVVYGEITSETTWTISYPLTGFGALWPIFGQSSSHNVDGHSTVTIGRGAPFALYRRGTETVVLGSVTGGAIPWQDEMGNYARDAVASDDNFLIIDYDSNGTFETILQFDFSDHSSPKIVGYVYENTNSSILDGNAFSTIVANAVPEPSAALLLGLGCLGGVLKRNRRTSLPAEKP